MRLPRRIRQHQTQNLRQRVMRKSDGVRVLLRYALSLPTDSVDLMPALFLTSFAVNPRRCISIASIPFPTPSCSMRSCSALSSRRRCGLACRGPQDSSRGVVGIRRALAMDEMGDVGGEEGKERKE